MFTDFFRVKLMKVQLCSDQYADILSLVKYNFFYYRLGLYKSNSTPSGGYIVCIHYKTKTIKLPVVGGSFEFSMVMRGMPQVELSSSHVLWARIRSRLT